jgi:RNA polymerase sigma-70 factor (ECF subfamily)
MSDRPADDLERLAAFKAGSESAARELFDKYCERLMALARRRIGARMTGRIDPEDVLQSAFRTFFARVKNDQFSFHGEDDLCKLLVRLTVRKALRQVAHHRAAKRNAEREAGRGDGNDDLIEQIVAASPSPEMEVAVADEIGRFVARLTPVERQILELRLEGYGTVEIADKIGSYDRKVRRVLERLQEVARTGGIGEV